MDEAGSQLTLNIVFISNRQFSAVALRRTLPSVPSCPVASAGVRVTALRKGGRHV